MARLSIPPHICEKVLNHTAGRTLSQVARVYNVHSYGEEVRRALEAWALEVERIATGEPAKVVAAELRRREMAPAPPTMSSGSACASASRRRCVSSRCAAPASRAGRAPPTGRSSVSGRSATTSSR